MMLQRRHLLKNVHRVGFGRVIQRLRRPLSGTPHMAMQPLHGLRVIESHWLMESEMSDEYQSHNEQHDGYQQPQQHDQHGQHMDHDQGQHDQQGSQQEQPAFQDDAQALVAEVAPEAETVSDASRLDAIATAIAALQADITELKAALQPKSAETDPFEARLAGLESVMAELKSGIGSLATKLTAVGTSVEGNKELHGATKAELEQQHDLMRGLNYIIVSAIGTLTTSAKAVKPN